MTFLRGRARVTVPAAACLLAAGLVSAPAGAHSSGTPGGDEPPWKTVASGLDNPRQLSFTHGTLYVAEAGVGGSGPCIEGAEGEACFGATGAVTRVRYGHQRRVLTGLPSLAGEGGGGALGPADVVVTGRQRYAVTIGLGNDPAVRKELPWLGRKLLGTMVTGTFHSARPRVIGDLAAYEERKDPDGLGADSNPTGMTGGPWGGVVTDSGGNTLLRVKASGRIVPLAVFDSPGTAPAPFPPFEEIPMQPVPTSVVRGPDGAWYVSELTGFPFEPGAARIHRVVRGSAPTVYATGLTNVTDLAWHDGDLYAVQISDAGLANETGLPMGSLVKVTPGAPAETIAGPLPAPYGIAVRHDAAYVTTCAVCADGGSVIRVPLD